VDLAGNRSTQGTVVHLVHDGFDPPLDRAFTLAAAPASCDMGDGLACLWLGKQVRYGVGVPEDEDKAQALYQKACDAGEPRGCEFLAEALGARSDGVGPRPDGLPGTPRPPGPHAAETTVLLRRALELHEARCSKNVAPSCLALASMYVDGRG